MKNFFKHKVNAKELSETIVLKGCIEDEIQSLENYGKLFRSIEIENASDEKVNLWSTSQYYKCCEENLWDFTSPYSLCYEVKEYDRSYENDLLHEYSSLYRETGDVSYYYKICKILEKWEQELHKFLCQANARIRYLYSKVRTGYRNNRLNFIRNIIKAHMQSSNDEEASIIKSYNGFLNLDLSFYNLLIPIQNEKETKKSFYRWLKHIT